jgi:hypothetical protein
MFAYRGRNESVREILRPYLFYDTGLHTFVSPIPWLPMMATFLTPFEIIVFFLIILLYPHGLIVISAVLKIICALARNEFWLYFSTGCFVSMQDAKNEVDEMKFFVRGLDSYNSYLRRNLKLQIRDLKKVYSKIASYTIEQKNNTLAKELILKASLYNMFATMM